MCLHIVVLLIEFCSASKYIQDISSIITTYVFPLHYTLHSNTIRDNTSLVPTSVIQPAPSFSLPALYIIVVLPDILMACKDAHTHIHQHAYRWYIDAVRSSNKQLVTYVYQHHNTTQHLCHSTPYMIQPLHVCCLLPKIYTTSILLYTFWAFKPQHCVPLLHLTTCHDKCFYIFQTMTYRQREKQGLPTTSPSFPLCSRRQIDDVNHVNHSLTSSTHTHFTTSI